MLRLNHPRTACVGLSCLSVCCLLLTTAFAADWPTFRGADRTAVSQESGLLQAWPEEGPPLVWETKGAGRSHSSLAVAGGKIFTLGDGPSGSDDKDEYLVCFNEADGQPLWKAKTGPAWNSGKPTWQGSRSTPSVANGLVYVVTPHGVLVCCETENGQERWRKDLRKEFGGNKADGWGYSESVLIDGDQVVCTPGSDKATLVALNKDSGEVIWTTPRAGDRGAGHASIVISEVSGTKVYVQSTGSGPMGVRANDGKLLWEYAVDKTTAIIPTPLVRGDLVYFVAGYGRGAALLKQIPGDNGDVKVEEVYPLNSKLGNKHGGVVLVGDYVFGDSEDKGVPQCVELMTGNVKWSNRGPGSGSASTVAADGDLYIHFANGTMVLAKASPEAYTEAGSFKIPHTGADWPSWAHPVVVNGRLYLRENDYILCYDIKAK